jgi:hypothetical protein
MYIGMKRILILSLLGALLGGCVIVPAGYGYRGDGYYRGNGYYHGDGYYRGDGYRGYGYRDHGG